MTRTIVEVIRRYCIDYTACHNLSVCDDIMEPDYTLHMGGHDVAGRDDAYKPAAARQFTQFPGLGLTVNELVLNGDRLALRFSEHGASARHGGALASWAGIGLYRWNGTRLTENYVEQDYFGRGRQLRTGIPDQVEAPAIAPWDAVVQPSNPAREALVRDWLGRSDPSAVDAIIVDDSPFGPPVQRLISTDEIVVNDIFSAGDSVAFHAVQIGSITHGDHEFASAAGIPALLHLAGVVTTSANAILGGRVVRDRLGLMRRLAAAGGQPRDAELR